MKEKRRSPLNQALVLCAIFVTAAVGAQKTEWKGSFGEEKGIRVVKNPREPAYERNVLALDEEICIGKGDRKGEPLFAGLWYLAVDDKENIYAMDAGDIQVKVFDMTGKFLRAIGRQGQGPGELLHPDHLFITDSHQLVVEDYIRNLTWYTLDGNYLRALSTTRIFPIGIALCPSGRIVALLNMRQPGDSGHEIVLYDEDLNPLKTVISIPSPNPDRQVLEPFRPQINWALSKSNGLVVSFKEGYEIEIFDAEGSPVKKILKDNEPVKITAEDVKQRVPRGVPEGRKLVVPKYFPAIDSLTTDDEGRIFVRTYEKAGDGRYIHDVFDAEGRYIAKVPLRDKLQVWKNHKLYSIEEDKEGFKVIRRYRVAWNTDDK